MRFASIASFAAVAIASVCGASTSEHASHAAASATHEASASTEASAASGACKTLAEIAGGNPDFSTLAELVSSAGLLSALNGTEGHLTVFAPTNEAFKKFNETHAGVLENLAKPENVADLLGVLTYHVHNGTLALKDLTDKEEIPTLSGKNITVEIKENKDDKKHPIILLNGVTLNSTVSVPACNGEVFILEDGILVPPTSTEGGESSGAPEASGEAKPEASGEAKPEASGEPKPQASHAASESHSA